MQRVKDAEAQSLVQTRARGHVLQSQNFAGKLESAQDRRGVHDRLHEVAVIFGYTSPARVIDELAFFAAACRGSAKVLWPISCTALPHTSQRQTHSRQNSTRSVAEEGEEMKHAAIINALNAHKV